jgi:hypothetical protein
MRAQVHMGAAMRVTVTAATRLELTLSHQLLRTALAAAQRQSAWRATQASAAAPAGPQMTIMNRTGMVALVRLVPPAAGLLSVLPDTHASLALSAATAQPPPPVPPASDAATQNGAAGDAALGPWALVEMGRTTGGVAVFHSIGAVPLGRDGAHLVRLAPFGYTAPPATTTAEPALPMLALAALQSAAVAAVAADARASQSADVNVVLQPPLTPGLPRADPPLLVRVRVRRGGGRKVVLSSATTVNNRLSSTALRVIVTGHGGRQWSRCLGAYALQFAGVQIGRLMLRRHSPAYRLVPAPGGGCGRFAACRACRCAPGRHREHAIMGVVLTRAPPRTDDGWQPSLETFRWGPLPFRRQRLTCLRMPLASSPVQAADRSRAQFDRVRPFIVHLGATVTPAGRRHLRIDALYQLEVPAGPHPLSHAP